MWTLIAAIAIWLRRDGRQEKDEANVEDIGETFDAAAGRFGQTRRAHGSFVREHNEIGLLAPGKTPVRRGGEISIHTP